MNAKIKIRALLSGCFLLCCHVHAVPQGKYTTRSSSAVKHYEQAALFLDSKNYERARAEAMMAVKADSNFIEARMLLGDVCSSLNMKDQAIQEYAAAIKINPRFFPNNFLLLSMLQIEKGYYEEADKNIQEFLRFPVTSSGLLKKAKKITATAHFGINAKKHPVPFAPVNMGDSINTSMGEYSPAVTVDGNMLFFTRLLTTGFPQEDIYISMREQGHWLPAMPLGSPVNTESNEGAICIAPDGHTLYFTASGREDGVGSCDIYEVQRTGNRWGEPHNLGSPVNTSYFDSQPSVSPDGRTLYFTSSRPGGKGKLDIWKSEKKDDGSWSVPVNMGDSINTDEDEQSPYIHPDNRTFYFISNGWQGMGGYDFFMSRLGKSGQWKTPENMGYPINGPGNERSLIVNARGDLAFIAAERNDSKGGFDLYSFELYDAARPLQVSFVKGKVYDQVSGKSLRAKVEILDLSTGKTASESYADQESGAFLACLPSGGNYAMNVSLNGYLFYSENFSLENVSAAAARDAFLMDAPLRPIKHGESVVLKNVFFETGSYALKEESRVELQKLSSLIKANPSMAVEIGGHTDNTGSRQSNQILSENRAKAVYDFLLSAGVQAGKLTYKGYGDTVPVSSNETEDGKARNRRTAFTVL